jgi:hypothetical protein
MLCSVIAHQQLATLDANGLIFMPLTWVFDAIVPAVTAASPAFPAGVIEAVVNAFRTVAHHHDP